jgi:tRNA A-37 threonylcarbamoyl transferase component Bud32
MTTHDRDHDPDRTELLTMRSPAAAAAVGEGLVPGARIGRYRIAALLGRGGLGEVYRAEQLEPVRRTVALKLLRAQRLDARHLAYFEVERQLLAQMRHPAIAQIYDADTTPDGHPFFAMEFIAGSPLTRFCDEHGLPLRERIELFVRVCEGVQHAHQKGVIHRDLKPANVLVDRVDGRALPKIIDFGIATAAARGERGEVAGTPDYMSPEQAGSDQAGSDQAGSDQALIDTRSDVYSLGVMLCELLTGRRPAAAGETVTDGTGTLRLPSQQLATLPPGEADAMARAQGTTLPRMRRLLRHELDWVVAKAMRHDRAERYPSAAALADDLRRFLDGLPLQAVPPARRYVWGKFVRRHRGALAAAGVAAAALLGGLGLSLYGLQQARAQRALAEARSADLAQVAAFQQSMLENVDVAAMGQGMAAGQRAQLQTAGLDADVMADFERAAARVSWTDIARETLQAQMLERALAAIARDFATQPSLAADLRESIADVQSGIGLYGRAADVLTTVQAQRERMPGVAAPTTLRAMRKHAEALVGDGRFDQARPLIERAGTLSAAALPRDDAERLRIEQVQARVLYEQGERQPARDRLVALLARARAAHGERAEVTLSILDQLAEAQAKLGDVAAGRAAFEDLYAWRMKTNGRDDPRTQAAMAKLAIARGMDDDFDGSLALIDVLIDAMRARLGAEHPDTLGQINTRVVTLIRAKRLEEARADLDRLVDSATRVLGAEHPRTLRYLQNQAALTSRLGDHARAAVLQRRLLELRTQTLGAEHPDTLLSHVSLGTILADAGRLEEGIRTALAGCEAMVRVAGETDPNVSGCLHAVGELDLRAGDASAAEPLLRRALEAKRTHDGALHPRTLESAVALDEAYAALGRDDERARLRTDYFKPYLAQTLEPPDPGQQGMRDAVAARLASQ